MRAPTRRLFVSLLAAAALVLSCAEPTPVDVPAPQADLLGSVLDATTSSVQKLGLLKCKAEYAQATQTVGKSGGVIQVGPHTLSIPWGALDGDVTITATAPKGNVNLVEFQPEGLVFKKSASLTMSYANCDLLGSLLPKRIAYVDDGLSILEYLLSLDNLLAKKVTGQLKHFSGYAVAW